MDTTSSQNSPSNKMIPYKVYTHYSVLKAYNHIDELVAQASKMGLTHLCITDYNTVSGAVEFIQECKAAKIVPIIGSHLQISYDGGLGYVTLLCKNKKGWYDLIKCLGNCKFEKGIDGPIMDLPRSKDLVYIFGGPECLTTKLDPTQIETLLGSFVKDGLTVFVSNDDFAENANGLDGRADALKIPRISTRPVFYTLDSDKYYQQILVCSKHKATLNQIDEMVVADPSVKRFFDPLIESSLESYKGFQTESLLAHLEPFDLAAKPHLPVFKDDNGKPVDPDEYLLGLCREGWIRTGLKDKVLKYPHLKKVYVDRINHELATFKEAGLSNYMLIIHDMANFVRKEGKQVGLRGSAVGCIVGYLIGLTAIDPLHPDPTLPYKAERALLFERFYSKFRNTKDHISLPDVDVDVGTSFRDRVITYVKKRYGYDCVGNIVTFGRLDGRGAIKEIFRVMDVPDGFDVANMITSKMVDTARVQDVLENLKEDDKKYNIVNYCIDHIPEVETFYGEYPKEFDTAIKLASTIRSAGRHAAGVVIGNQPLVELFPMKKDPKDDRAIVALEMADAEYVGAVKFDLLGVAALEKIGCICDMIDAGSKEPVIDEGVEELEVKEIG